MAVSTNESKGQESGKMKVYEFTFKVDMPKFAKNLGIDIPDDSADAITEDCGANSDGSVDVQDADVNLGDDMMQQYSLQGKCKRTLQECEAKNPLTCRFHGTLALASEIESELRKGGINGSVTCDILEVDGNTLTVQARVKALEDDLDKFKDALKNFLSLPGIEGDAEFSSFDVEADELENWFDIDMLDPNAQARWGFGQTPPPQQPQTQQSQQPQAPAAAPIKRTRTRKQTGKAVKTPQETPAEEPKVEVPAEQETAVEAELEDDDSPVLFPDDGVEEPPPWNPPYTDAELKSISKMALRLVKTARQINNHIENGSTDGWLAKTAPDLPGSLAKYKKDVEGVELRRLALKDTQGQLQALCDLDDAIEASEQNGWKTKVAEDKWDANAATWWDSGKHGNVDIHFDETKYADPYAKEREAFNAKHPASEDRKRFVDSLKEIDNSKAKDAPKDAANACRDAAKRMSDLEEGFAWAKKQGIADDPDFKKAMGQAYYKANEDYNKTHDECKKWKDGQIIARDTIADVIEAYKEHGIKVPAELVNMQSVEDEVKDRGWDYVASYHGLDSSKRKEYENNFKKNMRALFRKCPMCSCYDRDDVVMQILNNRAEYGGKHSGKYCENNHSYHAGNNTYVITQNAVFGLSEKKHTKSSKLKMHAYGTLINTPFAKDHYSKMYQGASSPCTILVNPKQCPIAYFGQYYSTHRRFKYNKDPKGRNYTGSYVNNANASMFAYDPSEVSKRAFTDDLSSLDAKDMFDALGIHYQTGEAWAIGGIPERAMLVIKETSYTSFTTDEIRKFNDKGITIMDSTGNIRGDDLIPDDQDLIHLVWGDKGRPKKK